MNVITQTIRIIIKEVKVFFTGTGAATGTGSGTESLPRAKPLKSPGETLSEAQKVFAVSCLKIWSMLAFPVLSAVDREFGVASFAPPLLSPTILLK